MARKEDAVARALAIEGEPFVRRSDLDDALAAAVPRQRLDRDARRGSEFAIGGLERVLGKGREDVGQAQLLVLLLVVDPELDQLQRRSRKLIESAFERFVHMAAIGADFVE